MIAAPMRDPRPCFPPIDGIGYYLAITIRGTTLGLISFRQAHEKEM